MSAANLEVVRRWQAAMSADPQEALAAVSECWDNDADYYPVRKFPEAQPCHGPEEISQFIARIKEAFSRSEWVIRELIEVGEDRVLARVTLRAEGRDSGIGLEGDHYQCFWLRHGRFFRVEDHLTSKGALHALGLEGETLEAAGLRGSANLDFVRSIYAAWGRGDFSAAEWAHPEIEFERSDPSEQLRWSGLAGMAEGWRDWLSSWEDFRAEVEEYRELDDGRILVLNRFRGRGKTSGLEVAQIGQKGASLFLIREGKVTRLVVYANRESALADLGLDG